MNESLSFDRSSTGGRVRSDLVVDNERDLDEENTSPTFLVTEQSKRYWVTQFRLSDRKVPSVTPVHNYEG